MILRCEEVGSIDVVVNNSNLFVVVGGLWVLLFLLMSKKVVLYLIFLGICR